MAGNASAICTDLATLIEAHSIVAVALLTQFILNAFHLVFCDLPGCPITLIREL